MRRGDRARDTETTDDRATAPAGRTENPTALARCACRDEPHEFRGGPTGDRTRDLRIKKASTPDPAEQGNRGDPEKGSVHEADTHAEQRRETPLDQSGTNGSPSGAIGPAIRSDPVDKVATAIERASAAGEWAVVAQLARELEALRLEAAGVPKLDPARRRRGR